MSGSALRPVGPGRPGPLGIWWRASIGDGRLVGILRLDPSLMATPGAPERVAALAVTLRRLSLGRVVRTADLLAEGGHHWLVAEASPAPTVADLLRPRLGVGAAVGVALDAGNAVRELIGAGIGHGRLGPETVAVSAQGAVRLFEAGLLHAVRGTPPDPWADIAAWGALVRTVTQAWCPGETGDAIAAAAASVDRDDEAGPEARLAAAIAAMVIATEDVPDRADREALAAAVVATQAVALPASSEPGPTEDARTLLPAPSHVDDEAEADEATRLGRRAQARAAGAAVGPVVVGAIRMRFGPGVPQQRRTPARPAGPVRPRRRRLQVRALLSGFVSVLMIGVVAGLWWWSRDRGAIEATASQVTAAQPSGTGCDLTVDFVGVVRTNGRPGIVRYQWERNGAERTEVLEQSARSGETSVQVHLYWTFRGEGRYAARATLRVLAPEASVATGSYTYSCAAPASSA